MWGGDEDLIPIVSPPLLALCSEFVSAASGGPSTSAGGATTTGVTKESSDANGAEKTSGSTPIAEIMACLGALWSTGKNLEGGAVWVSEAAATAAAVLGAAKKLGDQAAAVDAATQLATRCESIAPSPLDPTSAGCQSLLRAAARASEEAKGAALRENSVLLLGSILRQVWPRLSGEERSTWVTALNDMIGREPVPSVKSAAALLVAALR